MASVPLCHDDDRRLLISVSAAILCHTVSGYYAMTGRLELVLVISGARQERQIDWQQPVVQSLATKVMSHDAASVRHSTVMRWEQDEWLDATAAQA